MIGTPQTNHNIEKHLDHAHHVVAGLTVRKIKLLLTITDPVKEQMDQDQIF